jgi:glycosyltransferase involved in cell wall biosynthesis
MQLKILYLVPCSPAGKAFGTRMRIRQIGSALEALGTVDTMVVADGDEGDVTGADDAALPVRRVIRLRPITNRSPFNRLRCGIDPAFLGYHGRHVPPDDRSEVLDHLEHYDLVWIYQLSTADAFGRWRWPRSVLDFNDVPSTVLQTQARHGDSASDRLRARLHIPVARCREGLAQSRFTTLCVCSGADANRLPMKRTVQVIPNGFPRPVRESVRRPARPPRIGFVGTFEYPPNVEGVRWFIETCWPTITRAQPDVQLRLIGAGGGTPGVVPDGSANVTALGWVDDAESEIATWSMMIVPLRMGGGTRVKIAEGLSRRCPIVSTSFGAQGYDARDGREMLLSDTGTDFAAACIGLLRQPDRAAAIAERGWNAFLEHWTWEALRPAVSSAVDDCLRRERFLRQREGVPCADS